MSKKLSFLQHDVALGVAYDAALCGILDLERR